MSAGNHAQGVAYHAHPSGDPCNHRDAAYHAEHQGGSTEALGATRRAPRRRPGCRRGGGRGAGERARAWCGWRPFDDAAVIAGQGTVALELFADVDELDAVVVPVGGGGLLAGMAVVAAEVAPDERADRRGERALPVDVRRAARPARAGARRPDDRRGHRRGPGRRAAPGDRRRPGRRHRGGRRRPPSSRPSTCSSRWKRRWPRVPGPPAWPPCWPTRPASRTGRVGLVITGGNIDPRLLASVIMRGLVRSGRLCRLSVERDRRAGLARPGRGHRRVNYEATSWRWLINACSRICR